MYSERNLNLFVIINQKNIEDNGLLKCSEPVEISVMQLKCEFNMVVKLNDKTDLLLKEIVC